MWAFEVVVVIFYSFVRKYIFLSVSQWCVLKINYCPNINTWKKNFMINRGFYIYSISSFHIYKGSISMNVIKWPKMTHDDASWRHWWNLISDSNSLCPYYSTDRILAWLKQLLKTDTPEIRHYRSTGLKFEKKRHYTRNSISYLPIYGFMGFQKLKSLK